MPKYLTIGELERQLQAKQRELGKLAAKREKVAAKLAAIDRKIAQLSGGAVLRAPRAGAGVVKARRGRAVGTPLIEYIKNVMKGKEPMRVRDIQKAVLKAKYPTVSKDFYGIVAATVRDKKIFERVRRGLYKLKG
jgi:hypothetical protein